TPSPEVTSSYPSTSSILLPSIPTALIPTVTQSDTTPIIQYTRRARIAQSSALPTIADEPASPVRDDSQGEACPTDSGFITDQDRATIAKSSTLPSDSAPRVTFPATEEGSMQQTLNELTAFCTSLQRQPSELLAKFQTQEVEILRLKERVKILEDEDGVIGDKSGDDAPIKERSNNEGEAPAERISNDSEEIARERSNNEGEAPAERISNDSEEIARVLTSMDAATVLAREANVPIGNGFIPTAGPPATVISTSSEVGPTASLIARELEEQQEREDMRINEQIARDAEGEGSGTPTEPHHTPSLEVTSSHLSISSIPLPSIPTAPILPVPQTDITPIIQYSRRARIAQSSTLPNVADEPTSLVRDDSQGEACPTDSGFIEDQDRATIAKSSTLPRDSSPRVTSPAAKEGSMQQTINELTDFYTSLQRQHLELLAKFQAQEVEII
nr:hypothetical protein [Tanacetum cinerariifolium]